MKIKFISGLLACALSLTLLFGGCTSEKKQVPLDKGNPVTINIWHYYNGAQKTAFDQLVSKFNESVGMELGIIVEGYSKGNISELVQSVIDSASGKVGTDPVPNIFAAYADTAYQIDQLDLVSDLRPYLSQSELDEYLPSYIEEGKLGSENQLKIFPTAKTTEIFMMNKTDWDKFSAATGTKTDELSTMEGLTAVAKKYYEWTDAQTPDIKYDGRAFYGRDAMANYFIIGAKQLGTEIFSVKDGKVTFNLDETVMRKLWDNYYVPYISGYFAANGKFRSDDAKTGDIIALVGSTTSATYFPKSVMVNDTESYPIETVVMPAPCFKDGENYAVQQGAGMVVTKATEQEEYASVVFLRWFTEAKRNLEFSIMSGYMPVTKEACTQDMLNDAISTANTQTPFSGVMADTLAVGFKTALEQPLYTNQAFAGGTDARNVLETSMSQKAKEDANSVRALLDGGKTLTDAVAEYNTNENFTKWLTSLKQALTETQEGNS